MHTIRIAISLIILTLLLSFVQFGCRRDTDKEKIAKMLQLMQSAAESKQAGTLLDHISKNYRDLQGNDYKGIKGILLLYFFRHEHISIVMTGLEIEVHDAFADARFQAILSGRSGQAAVLPQEIGAYRFTVSLANVAGEWKVTSAQWDRFGD